MSSQVAHTPGPWTRNQDRDGRFRDESAGVRGPDGNYIAAAFDFNRTDRDAEAEADARLIAAAPSMFDAALRMRCWSCNWWIDEAKTPDSRECSMCNPLRAAIAKAKGGAS